MFFKFFTIIFFLEILYPLSVNFFKSPTTTRNSFKTRYDTILSKNLVKGRYLRRRMCIYSVERHLPQRR